MRKYYKNINVSAFSKLFTLTLIFLIFVSAYGVVGFSQQDDFLFRLSPELRSAIPISVRQSATNWTQEQQDIFVNRFRSQAKETTMAYITWFALGAHYAYLGDWGKQALYWITAGGLGIWALVDLFNMEDLVRNKNREIALRIAREVGRGLGG